MRRIKLEYGDGHLDVDLPDTASVVPSGAAAHEPAPLPDPQAATVDAIRNPVGLAPLPELVKRGSRVTIAFPDRVKGGAHATAHRRVTLRAVLAELDSAGVRRGDIDLVCAIGLHRKNFRSEFDAYLGLNDLEGLHPDQITNHDAEDPNGIVTLDDSDLGDTVQMNRSLIESDLTILIGHTAGNPYGGFSGGYKMPATGLTTWRSIAAHHSPGSMHRADFVPISTNSRFRRQLTAIGQRMESAMAHPFFTVDAVLNGRSEQLAVVAGAIPDVERATWPLATARTDVIVPGPPSDVLLIGMPRNFHYGNGMGSNPVLMMQAIGASLARCRRALVENPVVIAAAVCDGWFNESEFPATRAVHEAFGSVCRAADMTAYEESFATDPEWVYRYRHAHAYHPFHAFSMMYMGGIVREQALATIVVGAREPGMARSMGAATARDVDAALSEAGRYFDHAPRVLVVPELSKPAYHVSSEQS